MPEHQQTQQSKNPDSPRRRITPASQIPISNPMAIIQRARINPKSLTHTDVVQLQRTIGNRAVGKLLSEIGLIPSKAQQAPVQRQEVSKEEEPLQGKLTGTIQRQEPEEEEKLQMKSVVQRQEIPEEKESLQGEMIETIQRQEIPEEEELFQGKFESNSGQAICPSCSIAPIVQRKELEKEEKSLQGKMIEIIQQQEIPEEEEPLQTKKENNTGMPNNLKAGVENLSGISMSNVRVHYNSSKPAEVGALAYTQGSDIHIAPGQERHLPHEAWHVVQQAQGRVRPTFQMKGLAVNDDVGLELEADVMGMKAAQEISTAKVTPAIVQRASTPTPIQANQGKYMKWLKNGLTLGLRKLYVYHKRKKRAEAERAEADAGAPQSLGSPGILGDSVLPIDQRYKATLTMGQGLAVNLGQYILFSDGFINCSPIVLFNANTRMGGLFHFPSGALKDSDKPKDPERSEMVRNALRNICGEIQPTEIHLNHRRSEIEQMVVFDNNFDVESLTTLFFKDCGVQDNKIKVDIDKIYKDYAVTLGEDNKVSIMSGSELNARIDRQLDATHDRNVEERSALENRWRNAPSATKYGRDMESRD